MDDLRTLSEEVVKLFKNNGKTLSLAESITGGLIAKSITDVPGASSVLSCGYVTYTDKAKMRDLDVSAETLEKYTAVSKETAGEMVLGLHNRTGCDVCASVTGYAGPCDDGLEDVGLYYAGIYHNGSIKVYEFHSEKKSRIEIREDACKHILELINNACLTNM